MSHVDSYILTCGYEEPAILELNRVLSRQLESSDVLDLFRDAKDCAGGQKVPAPVWLYAGNYHGPDEVCDAMRSVTWRYAETVQLFWRGEGEDRWLELPWKDSSARARDVATAAWIGRERARNRGTPHV